VIYTGMQFARVSDWIAEFCRTKWASGHAAFRADAAVAGFTACGGGLGAAVTGLGAAVTAVEDKLSYLESAT
jgi:anti-sigma factor RsiW